MWFYSLPHPRDAICVRSLRVTVRQAHVPEAQHPRAALHPHLRREPNVRRNGFAYRQCVLVGGAMKHTAQNKIFKSKISVGKNTHVFTCVPVATRVRTLRVMLASFSARGSLAPISSNEYT